MANPQESKSTSLHDKVVNLCNHQVSVELLVFHAWPQSTCKTSDAVFLGNSTQTQTWTWADSNSSVRGVCCILMYVQMRMFVATPFVSQETAVSTSWLHSYRHTHTIRLNNKQKRTEVMFFQADANRWHRSECANSSMRVFIWNLLKPMRLLWRICHVRKSWMKVGLYPQKPSPGWDLCWRAKNAWAERWHPCMTQMMEKKALCAEPYKR